MDNTFFGLQVPFIDFVGATAEHWEKGRAVATLEVRNELTNSWQGAHGGVVMTLLDVTMGAAARSVVTPNGGVMTVDLSVNFIRSGVGRLTAEGRVLRGGRSIVFCEGELRDAEGELVAKAIGSFKVRRARETEKA